MNFQLLINHFLIFLKTNIFDIWITTLHHWVKHLRTEGRKPWLSGSEVGTVAAWSISPEDRCDTNAKEGFKGQGSSTWWAETPGRPGAVCNRDSCWKNQAPGTHRRCCRTLFRPGQTFPSCGNLQEDTPLKQQENRHRSNRDHPPLGATYLPACCHSLIQTDKLWRKNNIR